ncbi:fibronectin type III domain-containing protein [Pedobacter boryungensis]|uniref:Fibronectin type III domain-containing protein n=1 Tax=Pedobacter boryungensis TaxID=869962 RepID=A0ABX2DGA8_9SPHI|nr:fibronectin type III domain-containing protein [Pedobacter boryungensis]NQX31991.1 fibronectin type III domain-containing protein [Pedobacter boryungensis]
MKNISILFLVVFLFACKDENNTPIESSKPYDLEVVSSTLTSIKISWKDLTSVSGFNVYRKTGSSNYVKITSIAFPIKSYSDTQLTPGTLYTYKVTAVTADGAESLPTNELTVSTVINTVITGFSIPSKNFGDAPFSILPPISNSPEPFFYISGNENVAKILGNVITIIGPGSSIISVNQKATSNYSIGTISTIFTVNGASPTLSNFIVVTKFNYDPTRFPEEIIPPTSNSTGKFSYTSSDTSIASIGTLQCGLGCSIPTLEIKKAGTVTITANQAAQGAYSSGTISKTITLTN